MVSKKNILKNFVKLIGKHLCYSFPGKILKTTILQNICERLLLQMRVMMMQLIKTTTTTTTTTTKKKETKQNETKKSKKVI